MLPKSGTIDPKLVAGGRGNRLQVVRVGADDEVAAAQGSHDYACVDDVGGGGLGGQGAGRARPTVIEGLDVAASQQPGKLDMPG